MGLSFSQNYEKISDWYFEWEKQNDGVWYTETSNEEQDYGYCKVNGIIPKELYCLLKYNTLWDWLMPVIKKCIELNIWYSDQTNLLHHGLNEIDIDTCFEACVDFIKNYNLKKWKKIKNQDYSENYIVN